MRESLKYIHKNTFDPLVGVEVGVRRGDNAFSMLQTMRLTKLYLVDHYKAHREHSGVEVTQEQQDKFYEEMLQKLAPYKDKIEIIKQSSEEAVKLFPDKSLDFVYIDGCHTYDVVLQDLTLWLPKIKSKGFLCGHDFNNKCTPDVVKAVKAFCHQKNLSLFALDDIDWLTEVKHLPLQ